VVRTFGRDSSRNRVLLQTTEEEQQNLPDGGAKVTRSTSNPDANGRSQIVQRVVQETKKRAANVEETTTTTFLPGVNGGMTAAMKVHERQEHTGEHTVKVQKSTLLPDGAGNWQTSETKQSTITDDGNSRTTEESVSRTGGDGRLTEVSRTIGKESGNGSGNGQSTVETYSVDVPGSSSDGRMHLMQRVTTTNREGLSGSHATQQQVQQINPGDPGAGLQVTVQSTDTQTVGASGTHNARTIQMRGGDGSLNTVSVDHHPQSPHRQQSQSRFVWVGHSCPTKCRSGTPDRQVRIILHINALSLSFFVAESTPHIRLSDKSFRPTKITSPAQPS
jgi:hypothetical protein